MLYDFRLGHEAYMSKSTQVSLRQRRSAAWSKQEVSMIDELPATNTAWLNRMCRTAPKCGASYHSVWYQRRKRWVAMTRAACACQRQCQKPRQDTRRSVKDLPPRACTTASSHALHTSLTPPGLLLILLSLILQRAVDFSRSLSRRRQSSRTPANPANSPQVTGSAFYLLTSIARLLRCAVHPTTTTARCAIATSVVRRHTSRHVCAIAAEAVGNKRRSDKCLGW